MQELEGVYDSFLPQVQDQIYICHLVWNSQDHRIAGQSLPSQLQALSWWNPADEELNTRHKVEIENQKYSKNTWQN